jgi:hypothetical protein
MSQKKQIKQIKADEIKTSANQSQDKSSEEQLPLQMPSSSLNDTLIEILKKNPNHFLGCGG